MGCLLVFACDKVIELMWSIGDRRDGSSARGLDIPGYAHLHPLGGIMKTAYLSCLQFQGLVSWQDSLKLDRKGLWGFPEWFSLCVSS